MKQIGGYDVYGGGRAPEVVVLGLAAVVVIFGIAEGVGKAVLIGCFMAGAVLSFGYRSVCRIWLNDEQIRLDTLFSSYSAPWSGVRRLSRGWFDSELLLWGVRFSFTINRSIGGYKEILRRLSEKVPTVV
jgi:hypothetical protein